MAEKPRFVGERVRLGDVLQVVNGKNQKAVEDENGQYPIYGSGGQMGWASSYICPANTVIIGRKGNINKPIYVSEPFWNVDTAFGLVAKPEVLDARYLYHFCRHFDFEKLNTTCTIPSLTRKNIEGILLRLPSFEKQKEMTARFDSILKQITLAQQQLSSLDVLVKSRFVEMFGDPVANPKGWGVSTIKKTAITYGDGPFGSNLKSADYVPSGVRVIRLGNIMRGEFSEKDQSYVSYEKFESLRKYECIPGEVVIATLGDPILRACIVPDFGAPSIHKADCMYYETNKEMVLPIFAMCAINQPSMLQRASLDSHGQTRARINSTQAGNLPMILPPMDLQQEFADFVTQVDKSRFIAQQQIEKLQMLYDSLAQEYFA